jgi:transcriptional regulator with XRE-family HTH domain
MAASFNQQWVAAVAQAMSQDEKVYFKAFGARIAQRRKQLGLTQIQMGEALGIAQQTYASYETGRRRVPVSALSALAQALALEVDILLGHAAKTKAKRGPAPQFQKQIEQISQLPKPRQRFIIQMLETALVQQSR